MLDAPTRTRKDRRHTSSLARLEKLVGSPATVALRWRLSPASRRWRFGPTEGAMIAWRAEQDWFWIDEAGQRKPASRLAVAQEIAAMLQAELGERQAARFELLNFAKSAVVRLER